MVRLSIFEVTWKDMRVGKLALRQPLYRTFDVLARNHHQVGHLVDDDDDIGQRIEIELLVLVNRLASFAIVAGVDRAVEFFAFASRFGQTRIVAVDVAHAELRHLLVALFHFAHCPFERHHRFFRIGDHWREQMRDAVVDRQFEHFWIDHDQPALLRAQPINQAQDHGVDGDRFAGAGSAGDQQMRHALQIDQHRFAADRFAEAQRQSPRALGIVARGEQFTQIDPLAARVRQFDADGISARHHGNAR
jgi:hypothetical protein